MRARPGLPAHRWGSASGRAARLAGIVVAAALLAAPMAAQAQSSVQATATPSPFTLGATIAIEASVTSGDSPEGWCFATQNCHIVGVLPFLHVSGSNGFFAERGSA